MMIGATAFAQQKRQKEMGRQKVEKMAEIAQLTTDQKRKIQEIHHRYEGQMEGLKTNKEVNAVEIAKLKKAQKEEIEKVLTAEQKDKLKKYHDARKQDRENLKKDLADYKKKNIEPVLREKRQLLESQLTDLEKKVIADMRIKANAQKDHMKEVRKELEQSGMDDDESVEHRRQDMKKQNRQVMKEIHESLKPIAENHESILNNIEQELKPQQEKWKKDMQDIKAKYTELERMRPEEPPHATELPDEGKKTGKEKEIKKEHYRFILMNPDEPIKEK